MMNLREKIQSSLKKAGISIPKLARQIGCNQQTLYNYFAGRSQLSADKVEKILNLLEIKFQGQ